MRIVSFICAGLLLLSICPLEAWGFPSWTDRLWQSFVCAGAFWLAWKDYRDKSLATWNLALVMLGILYNPIFPIVIDSSYISGALKLFCVLFLIVFGFKRNVLQQVDSGDEKR